MAWPNGPEGSEKEQAVSSSTSQEVPPASKEITPEEASEAVKAELEVARQEMLADSGEHAGAAEVISTGHGAEIKKVTDGYVDQAAEAAARAEEDLAGDSSSQKPKQVVVATTNSPTRPYSPSTDPEDGPNVIRAHTLASVRVEKPVEPDAIPVAETDAAVPAGFEAVPADPVQSAGERIAAHVGDGKSLDEINLPATKETARLREDNLEFLATNARNAIADIERHLSSPDITAQDKAALETALANQRAKLAGIQAEIGEERAVLGAFGTLEEASANVAPAAGSEQAPVVPDSENAAAEEVDTHLAAVRNAFVDAEESLKRWIAREEKGADGKFAPRAVLGDWILGMADLRENDALNYVDSAAYRLLSNVTSQISPEQMIWEMIQEDKKNGFGVARVESLGIDIANTGDGSALKKLGDLVRARVNYMSVRAARAASFNETERARLVAEPGEGSAAERAERMKAEISAAVFEKFVAQEYQLQIARRAELLEQRRADRKLPARVASAAWQGIKSGATWWRSRSKPLKIGISLAAGLGIGVATGGIATLFGAGIRATRTVVGTTFGAAAAEFGAAVGGKLGDKFSKAATSRLEAAQGELEQEKGELARGTEYAQAGFVFLENAEKEYANVLGLQAKLENRKNIFRALGAGTGAVLVGGGVLAATSEQGLSLLGSLPGGGGASEAVPTGMPKVVEPLPSPVAQPGENPSIFMQKHAPDPSQFKQGEIPPVRSGEAIPQTVVPAEEQSIFMQKHAPDPSRIGQVERPVAEPPASSETVQAPAASETQIAQTPAAESPRPDVSQTGEVPAGEEVKPATPAGESPAAPPAEAPKPAAPDVAAEQARVKAEGFEITKENNSIWKAVEHQVTEYAKRPDADYTKLGIKQEELVEFQQNPGSKESARILDRVTARAITANNLQNMGIRNVGARVLWTPDSGKIVVTEGDAYKMSPVQEPAAGRPRAAVPDSARPRVPSPTEPAAPRSVDTVLPADRPAQPGLPSTLELPKISSEVPLADVPAVEDVPEVQEIEVGPGEEWKIGLYQSQVEAAAPKIKLFEVTQGIDLDKDGIADIQVKRFMAIDSKLPYSQEFAVQDPVNKGKYYTYSRSYRTLESAMEQDPNWRPRPDQMEMKVKDFVKNRIAENGNTKLQVQAPPEPAVEKPAAVVQEQAPVQAKPQNPFDGYNPVKAAPGQYDGYNPVRVAKPDVPPPPPKP